MSFRGIFFIRVRILTGLATSIVTTRHGDRDDDESFGGHFFWILNKYIMCFERELAVQLGVIRSEFD